MEIGVIIIGDEILSGKRQDRHFARSVEILAKRGLSVSWVNYLPDDSSALIQVFSRTLKESAVVFSFGGIGATPDDHTRQSIASALQLPLVVHSEAKREIEEQFGEDAYPHRIKMGMFPEGSRIIPNAFNRIPGFSIHRHHFLPGFPSMAWDMMEWVLDNEYEDQRVATPNVERSILILDVPESELIPVMDQCLSKYPMCKVFSLPTITSDRRRKVELGVKGPKEQVSLAFSQIQQAITDLGFEWSEL